jgi:hypothetical protein
MSLQIFIACVFFLGDLFRFVRENVEHAGAGIVRKFASRSFAVRFESGLKFRNRDGELNAVATSDATCDAFENRLAWYVSLIDRHSERSGRAPHVENRRLGVSGADSDYAKLSLETGCVCTAALHFGTTYIHTCDCANVRIARHPHSLLSALAGPAPLADVLCVRALCVSYAASS